MGEDDLQCKFAIVEYKCKGKFPGLAPYGNLTQVDSEYLRTPQLIMEEANEHLEQDKPKIVHENLKLSMTR